MQIEPSQFTKRAAWTIWKMTRKSTWHKIQGKLWCKALVKVHWLDKNDKISYQLQKGIAWKVCNFEWLSRAGLLLETEKRSSWPVTGLWNRGPLKDLNDFKLIVYECKWFPWSSRINFLPFRIFRGPLFHKPVTGQELLFAVSYNCSVLNLQK